MRAQYLRYVLMVLLAGLCAAPAGFAHAKTDPPNPLTKYLKKRSYKRDLYNTAAAYAMRDVSCPAPNERVIRISQHVLHDVIFQPRKTHPVGGIWFERTQVVLCGRARRVDVTVMADSEGGAPEFLAGPGRAASQNPASGSAR